MSLIEYQRTILSDPVRNRAFEEALRKVIVPGETIVADIGAGTGFLSFLARKLGAKECYLYEVSELSNLSREIAKKNGITGYHFIHSHSFDVKNPPKADVVISETLGNFALEESIIGNLNDAKRFLKPKDTIIPGKLRQYVCPVIGDRIQKSIDTWHGIGHNIDWSPARTVGLNNMFVKEVTTADLLKGGTQEWDTIDFSKRNNEKRKGILTWDITGTIHGFALWWEAELVPGVILSTNPSAKATHWQQIYLPLEKALNVKAGESLELTLNVDSSYEVRINLAWQVIHKDKAGKVLSKQSMDMRKGFLS